MIEQDKDFLIAIADGRASAQEYERYRKLCQDDPHLEQYVALLRATRQRLRRAAQASEASDTTDLLARIRGAVEAVEPLPRRAPVQWWWIAAAAAVIALVWIVAPWRSSAVDFRAESLENFQRIMSGKLSVAKATSNFNELVAFFRAQGVGYQLVTVPLRAELVGGVVSEHNGVKLAHFVYRRGDTLIYMYQAPQELFKRGILAVPATIEPYAESGKWYAENIANNSWMFWRVQSVYCSVVASVPKEVLATYFVEGVL